MSARSNASGKRPIASNGGDNNVQPPQLRRPRQSGDTLNPKHDSPFTPGVQDRTLGLVDGAFQAMSDNLQAIEQYTAHLEELLLHYHSSESIQYHIHRLEIRDSAAGSRSICGRQRTTHASPQHGASIDGDTDSLFIPENGVSSRKRMQSVEGGSLFKKARTDRSIFSGALPDLGENLLDRRLRLNSSSSETILSKTVRKPVAVTTQHTATAQRTTSAQSSVASRKTVLKPASEAASQQTTPVCRPADQPQTTTTQQTATSQPTTSQMAKRLSTNQTVRLQEVAKALARNKSSKHESYPAFRWNERPTSNFQPVPKPSPAETISQSEQPPSSTSNAPQTQTFRRDSAHSDGALQADKGKGPLVSRPLVTPLRPPVSKSPADARPGSITSRPATDIRSRLLASVSDAAARPGSHASRSATRVRSGPASRSDATVCPGPPPRPAADSRSAPFVPRPDLDVRSRPPTPRSGAGVRSGPLTPKLGVDARSRPFAPELIVDTLPAPQAPKSDVSARSVPPAPKSATEVRSMPPTPRLVGNVRSASPARPASHGRSGSPVLGSDTAARSESHAPRPGAIDSSTPASRNAADAHSISQSRAAAGTRSKPFAPTSSANSEPLARRRDAATRPRLPSHPPAVDVRPDPPAHRPTPSRPGYSLFTDGRFNHHVISPRRSGHQLPHSRSSTPVSSNAGSSSRARAQAQAHDSPAGSRHGLPARPQSSFDKPHGA